MAPAIRLGAQAALAEAVESDARPYLVIARDARELDQLRAELTFFLGGCGPFTCCPDWEVLPYDIFSPHPDIISERLAALRIAAREFGGVAAPADTIASGSRRAAMWMAARSMSRSATNCHRTAARAPGRERLCLVAQVTAPGEFALRGSLFDVFPMGRADALRVDLVRQ